MCVREVLCVCEGGTMCVCEGGAVCVREIQLMSSVHL